MIYITITQGASTWHVSEYTHTHDGVLYDGRLLNAVKIVSQLSEAGTSGAGIDLQIKNPDRWISGDLWAALVEVELPSGLVWHGEIKAYDHDGEGVLYVSASDSGLPELDLMIPDEVAHVFDVSDLHSSFVDYTVPIALGGTAANPLFVKGILISKTSFVYLLSVGEIRSVAKVYKGTEEITTGFTAYTGTAVQAVYPGFACVVFDSDPRNDDGTWPDIYADVVGMKLGTCTEAECRNPARILYYLLTTARAGIGGWGLGVDAAKIDAASFNQAIADCDTFGFHIDGVIHTKQQARYWVDQITRACRGNYFSYNGKRYLSIGKAGASVQTYDLSNMRLERHGKGDSSKRRNRVVIDYRYNPITQCFTANETREDSASISLIKEQKFSGQLDLVNEQATAGAIADFELNRSKYGEDRIYFGTLTPAQPGQVITINRPDLGLNNALFCVTSLDTGPDEYLIDAQSYSDSIYTVTTPGTAPAEVTGDLPVTSAYPPAAPSGLDVHSDVDILPDGSAIPYIYGSFTLPAGAYLGALVQWGIGATPAAWTVLGTIKGNTFRLSPVIGGTTYTIKVTAINSAGSSPSITSTIVAATDSTAPLVPQAPVLSTYFKSIAVKCLQNLTKAPDHASFDVYRNTTNNSGTATKIGSAPCLGNTDSVVYLDEATAFDTTYYYWIKSVDTSGNISGFSAVAGPVSTQRIISGDLAAGALNSSALFAQGVVDAAAIANCAVTAAKTCLAAINQTTGCINACMVGSTQLVDCAVSSVKLADAAVTAAKTNLAAISNSTGCLNAGTVGTTQVVDCAIATAKLAACAVTCPKIAAGAIYACHVSAGAIEAGAIKAGAICTCHLVATGISGSCITACSITATQLATSGLITLSAQICDAIIVNSKIACLDAGKINTGSLAAARIAAGSLSADKIAGTALVVGGAAGDVNSGSTCICGGRIVTGSLTSTQIVSSGICGLCITAGTLTGDRIAANTITASNLLIAAPGAALNADPGFLDTSAWGSMDLYESCGNFSIATVTDGKVGSGVLRGSGSSGSSYDGFVGCHYIPIDPTKTYRLSAWIRARGTTNGSVYLSVREYNNAKTALSSNLGTYLVSGAAPSTTWTQYYGYIGPSGGSGLTAYFNAATAWARVGGIMDYLTTTGLGYEVQDLRLEEVLPATLIQDGVITTSKIISTGISGACICAGSITSGHIVAGGICADVITSGVLNGITVCTCSGNIGSWTIQPSYLCHNIPNVASMYLYPACYGIQIAAKNTSDAICSLVINGKLWWGGSYQNAVGVSVTSGTSHVLTSAMGHSIGSLTLPDASTVASGCPFFWVGNTTNYVKFNAGVLTVRGDVVADGSITAAKLAVPSSGSSLNADPGFQDSSAWTGSLYITTITDGVAGLGAFVYTAGTAVYHTSETCVPLDRTKTYRFRAWARTTGSATSATLYLGSYGYDYSGTGANCAQTSWGITTSWAEYSVVFPGTCWTATSRYIRPHMRLQFSGTGSIQVQDYRLEEVMPTALIKDGAITTGKVASGAIGGLTMTSTALYSSNYSAGSAGFCIGCGGNAEFNNVTVRGTVCATAGCFSGSLNSCVGNIGGWSLGTGYICGSCGTNYAVAHCLGLSEWRWSSSATCYSILTSGAGYQFVRACMCGKYQTIQMDPSVGIASVGAPFTIYSPSSSCCSASFGGQVWAPAYCTISDRLCKSNIRSVDVLPRLRGLPITEWTFSDSVTRRIGPMAQDFFQLFPFYSDSPEGVGGLDGIALKGVQELDGCVGCLQACICSLEARIANIEARLPACA